MGCATVRFPDGTTGILCGGRGKRSKHRCFYCTAIGEFQCDNPVLRNNRKGTCDTWMCNDCRNNIGNEIDLCRPHFNSWRNNGNRFKFGASVVA
jgi:hypothetical protein